MRRLCGVLAAAVLMALCTPAGAAAQTACPVGYLASVSSAESALSATPPDTAAATTLLHQAIAAYPAQSVLGPIVTELEASPPRI
ncbi:MAG: hypothetical protein JOZ75_11505, partial [Candidatus Dormibacteraeota bacterium]|nr:hypothetical protein [Candidatus Dormibacteraeota bacterium]